ncbi:hypothetical protein [Lysinibacillus sp. 38-6]|uniref:hypothetical protein n=1 Tax=Lysinibacillus sp. 38-6 TaxID=3385991 RepID=UPI0039089EAE
MKLSRILLLIFVLITGMVFIALFVFWNNAKEKSEVFYHSSTMNIEVIDKYKNDRDTATYFLKSKNSNEPFQTFVIEVQDENVWNLVEVNGQYFVNVYWETESNDINIQDKATLLLQIDKL